MIRMSAGRVQRQVSMEVRFSVCLGDLHEGIRSPSVGSSWGGTSSAPDTRLQVVHGEGKLQRFFLSTVAFRRFKQGDCELKVRGEPYAEAFSAC